MTDNNYYVIMADLIANVARCYCHLLIDVYLADVIAKVLADVIAKPFMADVIDMCGGCCCHY